MLKGSNITNNRRRESIDNMNNSKNSFTPSTLRTLPNYGNSSLPYSIEMVWFDEDDVDYTGSLFPTSKTSSIIEGEKVEGVKNLLLEFSNKVADNDESEVLENAITPTKRLSSVSEDSKVQGDTSTCKKIKIENET
ncbi:uncharacterized protein DS421_14g475610 [Arachis hypogaea]|nr:uncharacterized protein DS421_14g475610 [Arachis hypogaea]